MVASTKTKWTIIGVVVVIVVGLFGWWLAACGPVLDDLSRMDDEGLFGENIHWSRDEVESALSNVTVARKLQLEVRAIRSIDCDLPDPVYNYTRVTCEVRSDGSSANSAPRSPRSCAVPPTVAPPRRPTSSSRRTTQRWTRPLGKWISGSRPVSSATTRVKVARSR